MKVTMDLTMAGLVRSLRGFVHDLSDELEHSQVKRSARTAVKPPKRGKQKLKVEGATDERRG